MAQDTTNYNLKKNENSDDTLVALVTNQSSNMDTIDAKMKENEDKTDSNSNNTDILRGYATVGGTADSITLTSATAEDFDFTIDGNPIRFVPTSDNTGGVTVNVDGNGAVDLLKPDGAGGTTALEAGDLTNGVPVQIDRRVSGDFFFYAPKGGSNIKSVQRGQVVLSSVSQDVTISGIDVNNSVVLVTGTDGNVSLTGARYYLAGAEIINSTTIRIEVSSSSAQSRTYAWQVIEFNNVKSRQSGSANISNSTSVNVSISSVDLSKSILFYSTRYGSSSGDSRADSVKGRLTSSSNINFATYQSGISRYAEWQVIEFK